MALAQLLGNLSSAAFLERHYHKLPLAHPGNALAVLPGFGWENIGRILAQPEADVLAGREGQHWTGSQPRSLAQAQEVMAAGYTLGVRHAEKHDPALAALAADFQHDFLAPIDVHLYCTPQGQPGFGWHYDAEDVFLLQLHGSKEWRLRKNTVNPWPLIETIPADMRYEREIMPVLHCRLEAGDWLYIPAGYWHRSQAGEESISLSVGIRSVTALEAYDFMRQVLLSSLRWRQRLPVAGTASAATSEELLRQYQAIFSELGQDLARLLSEETTARSFLQHLGRAMN